MMGGDPNQAARNIDQQATNLAGSTEPVQADPTQEGDAPPAPKSNRFNNHTQGLAGALIAKEEDFKRASAELDLRQQDADRALNEAAKVADAAYQQAVATAEEVKRQAVSMAGLAHQDAVEQIVEERGNLSQARRAIDAALDVLSR